MGVPAVSNCLAVSHLNSSQETANVGLLALEEKAKEKQEEEEEEEEEEEDEEKEEDKEEDKEEEEEEEEEERREEEVRKEKEEEVYSSGHIQRKGFGRRRVRVSSNCSKTVMDKF